MEDIKRTAVIEFFDDSSKKPKVTLTGLWTGRLITQAQISLNRAYKEWARNLRREDNAGRTGNNNRTGSGPTETGLESSTNTDIGKDELNFDLT